MQKILLTIILGLVFVHILTTQIKANENFNANTIVTYQVDPSGQTRVSHEITLTNLNSTLYASTYSLNLENIDVQNVLARDVSGTAIPFTLKKDGDNTNILLTFDKHIVGKGSMHSFVIAYDNSNFAVRTGEVWEISIPKLGKTDFTESYTAKLVVPDSFGLEAYISPKALSFENVGGYKYYSFSRNELTQTGITAGFGHFQVFSFNLFYHLENPLPKSVDTFIAIPPDTAYQKIYFTKIYPEPIDVKIDSDGNWIAKYKLAARQRLDVNVSGSVQIFAGYRHFPKPSTESLKANLKEDIYWEIGSKNIKEKAEILKTPQNIYNYVVSTLKYNVERVKPNTQRTGAVAALSNPENSICIEFTDLFIALARAAGIPAREINGFAYTENKDLQPLGLVADVLHSWPEYYDSQKGVWIPVDPTWGSTSGGVDYFNKLDLRHFTFVIHGASSTKPYPPGSYKLGANPQKDVFVSFGVLPEKRLPNPNITIKSLRNIPFLNTLYSLKIRNPGPTSLESITPTVYFDSKVESKDIISLLPPYASYEKIISVPYSFLANNTPDKILVTASSSKLEVPINKIKIIINSLILFFAGFLVILLFILIRLKKFTLYEKIISKIKKRKTS